jgi:hypothetical protein
MKRRLSNRWLVVAASATMAAVGALLPSYVYALREPVAEALHARVLAPAGFNATVVPVELSRIADEVPAATLAAASAFDAESGHGWRFYVDRRSGGMALVEGSGVVWSEHKGSQVTLDELEAQSRSLMQRYPDLFQVPGSQLVLDRRASVNLGERGQFWNVVYTQTVGGVPVDNARVVFRVADGKLVQFGIDRTIPVSESFKNPGALLSAAQARTAFSSYVGGLTDTDTIHENGTLAWIPRGTDEAGAYTGPVGGGWKPEIVYRYTFNRAGSVGTWQGLVSAKTGAVIRFIDASQYASVLKASVYPKTNCADPLNCVPGSALETGIAVPNASISYAGAVCSGNACYSNSAGAFDYPAGAVSSTTALDGKYFRLVDSCGAVTASAVAPGNIDLGTSLPNPPLNTNTDCAPATQASPPGSGAVFGGSGDTHSARNTFYHLNLINQKGRVYLPNNEWLKGVDGASGSAQLNVNLPPACNALWQGTTGSLNFMRQTPGLGCNNTGEVPGIFLHEWGHGLDQNDATSTAPESGTGEATGDTFALLQAQNSCAGEGFLLDVSGAWGNQAGYGTGSALCTAVRELDYTRFCYHGTAASCSPSPDPGDAPNGSRSGFNPPANVPDSGTPARWNTMITGALNTTNGQSNFYNCGGPEADGCAGALDHGCHCESQIGGQSNWDLVKKLIAFEFGGDVYRNPQGPTEVSGWQYMDRLWYLTRDLTVSSYSATGPAPTGTTNGCAINNWFTAYRFIDDDNADLADGTPHAGILFQAFDLHATACGAASDAANQPTGCPAPIAAPTLSACENKSPVQLNWTPSAGTDEYRILRNTLGCGFGFTPIATVSGGRTYFEDTEVAPGVPYYYSVQPVGANESCYGQASNCIVVTPSSCAATPVPAPTGLTLATPADNQVNVSWNSVVGAGSYKVYRKAGNCASTAPFVPITVVAAPAHAFLDTDNLNGEQTYSYQVATSDASCASCTSAPSACQSVTVVGACTAQPDFAGLATISTPAQGTCRIDLAWPAAAPHCSGPVSYAVYRSTNPAFVPSPASLIASGLAGTAYQDFAVFTGTRYFYVVRAVDGSGNNDGNVLRKSEIPAGVLTPGTFTDNAGDTGTVKLSPGSFGVFTNTWSIRPNDAPDNATKVYATTPSGNYPDNSCMSLESQTIFLGANPTLSFSSKYDMEPGWDGGYVDVATEAGGFSNWTKLSTINYPSVMGGPAGDPACNTPGFAAGQMAFTGTSAAGYQTFSGSLSAYANQRVRIRFLFGSDPSTNQGGWLIDDVSVTDAKLPGPCSTDLCSSVTCDDGNVCTTDSCNAGNGQCVFTPLPPPLEVGSSVRLAKSGGTSVVSWSDDGTPGPFQLYRGTRTNGVPFSYNQQCLGATTAGTSSADGDTPSSTSPYFYLVTRKTQCGESVAGRDSTGTAVPNNPCP